MMGFLSVGFYWGVDQLSGLIPALAPIGILYITPDQILPLTSVMAAIVGVLLMFWNRMVALFRKLWQLFNGR